MSGNAVPETLGAEGNLPMKRNARRLSLLFTLGILLAGASLWAATQNALVTGTVYDQAGGPVAGATARLINAGIGYSQSQQTDDNGTYTFTAVPPAEGYMLSVEKSGFATDIRQDLEVSVGDNKLVLPPFILQPVAAPPPPPPVEPGKPPVAPPTPPVPPPVAVKPPAPTARPTRAPSVSLDLVSTTAGGVIDSRTVRTLPLAGRDFLDLALLVPGTYPVEQGSALEGASMVVNGVRANMNNFLLDGVDNNDYTINQSLPFQIVEAMQEFRVQTSGSAAEYGRSGGAQINTISRTGSNVFHGTLFGFGRNSAISSRNFFSVYNGGTFDQYNRELMLRNELGGGYPVPTDDPAVATLYQRHLPKVNQIQFGANAGGALKKDKLFGFFNWEGFRVSNPRPVFEHVPELYVRDASWGDPIAYNLHNLYPRPYITSTTAGIDPYDTGFFAGESANKTSTDNLLGRVDWRKSDRVSMSFKHNMQWIDQTQGGAIPATETYPGSGTSVTGLNQNFSYNYVHQITPRTTNEFRLGWNRFRLQTRALDRTVDPAALGLYNVPAGLGLPSLHVGGVFTEFAPYATLGADPSVPSARADTVWSGADNISIIHGRHNLKLGGEVRYARLNVANEGMARGLLTFYSGEFVAATGWPDVASIARVSQDFGGDFARSFRSQSFNVFAQDQWRVRSNLTINAGVRYEVNTAPVEVSDRLVNYYTQWSGLMRANSKIIYGPYGEDLGTARSPAPRAGFDTDYNNVSLHAGFAWDPHNNGKTVFRAGYAVMFDQQPMEPSVNMLLNPPFVQQWFTTYPDFDLADTFPAGFPGPGIYGQWFDLNGDDSWSWWNKQPYSITARDPQTRTPYVNQFHAGLQQRLGNKMMFEVAYAGSLGRKLPRLRDMSPCTPAMFYGNPDSCFGAGVAGVNPFLLETILNQENSASSNFHSLILRFDVRNLRGLNLRMHYQWAKSIDTASSLQPQVFMVSPLYASLLSSFYTINPDNFAAANNISPTLSLRPDLPIITTRPRLAQDQNNLAGERGRSDFDVRQRLVFSYIYDVPKWERAGRMGNGWQVAGITTLQSGQPYSIFMDYFGNTFRPDELYHAKTSTIDPAKALDGGTPIGRTGSAFDLSHAFKLQPGNLGRNTYIAPPMMNFDVSLLKNTYFGEGERTNLQFRVEFLNALNNTNFREPISQAGLGYTDWCTYDPDLEGCSGISQVLVYNPFFGKILQSRPARQIQFGLKFVW
jgi:hypothetical protein